MLHDVLAYIHAHQGAPVTEIKRHFGLSSDMAANLLIQLEDAGYLHEQQLEACHHMDAQGNFKETGGGCGSGGCGSGGCSSGGGACAVGEAFERGCCGMNSPYRVTARGEAFLTRMRAIAG
ncbi:hypothetical protein J7643_10650 [bacterium]|nr:hypothetical protein [bacterium]